MQHRVKGAQLFVQTFKFRSIYLFFQEALVADIGFYLLFFVRFSSAASMLIWRS